MRLFSASSPGCLTACVGACLLAFSPINAQAKIHTEDYMEANLIDLTKFAAHYKAIDITNAEVFREYLKITECAVYKNISTSPFKLQEAQQAIVRELTQKQHQDKELYFRIPVTFRISGYNFDTQSFPVIRENQFNRVNILELTKNQPPMCGDGDTVDAEKVSASYFAKLNAPISVFRIPIQRDIAESISNRLVSSTSDPNIRTLYGYILLQVEAIQPEVQTNDIFTRTLVRGNVMAIDLFIDQGRRIMFKRLDYEENY